MYIKHECSGTNYGCRNSLCTYTDCEYHVSKNHAGEHGIAELFRVEEVKDDEQGGENI